MTKKALSKLIIVESPTKARTLTGFLGSGYSVMASYGHVRDLPQRKIAIDFDHDFKPDYVVEGKDKLERVSALKEQAKKSDSVILATDPDREGEAIAWHIKEILGEGAKKHDLGISRITFHEITKPAIEEAMKNPREIDLKLVDAQQARRILDRIFGYKLSPLLWRKVRKGLSAGRVQSVAVRLIVEREREVEKFIAVEYWDIRAEFYKEKGERERKFIAMLSMINGEKAQIQNEAQAKELTDDLVSSSFSVADVSVKEVRRYPLAPFTTSTLQQAGANKLYWTAKRTMQVAQSLYEEGYITYMRTDSVNLAKEAVFKARDLIVKKYGESYLPADPKFYKTKSKVAQEAHEAIRPTDVSRDSAEVTIKLGRDAGRLYELVWQRMMSCQMSDAVFEQTTVDVSGKGEKDYLFRVAGTERKFDGWLKVYDTGAFGKDEKAEDGEDNNGSAEDQETKLPDLLVDETLALTRPVEKALIPTQHFTEPPPRFNEASLIKTMEEYGIGRPSTYAPIISTIQERQYVEKMDRRFKPTPLGIAVNDFLMANFADLLDYKFTAGMEDELDEVANGERKWVPVLRDFYEPFNKKLLEVGDKAERVKVAVEETDEKCPECQAPLVVRIGKFGRFLACSRFPDCKFTKPYVLKIGVKCPDCKEGDVIMRKTKSKKTFYGCSRYPDCRWASWTKPKIEVSENTKQNPIGN